MQIHKRESKHLSYCTCVKYVNLRLPLLKKKLLLSCVCHTCIFYCARSTFTTRMPWVNWTNAATYPYPSMAWNVELLPQLSLAIGSPQSGNCPSICSKTTPTLTQHISRIMWYQG